MSLKSIKADVIRITSADANDVDIYLDSAVTAILNRLYPFSDMESTDTCVLPRRYEALARDICVYLINKRGGEGETSHSENGISRHYESAHIPESMLSVIIPKVKVPTGRSAM